MVRNLKITALYSAEVIEPYSAEDKDFGTVSIQVKLATLYMYFKHLNTYNLESIQNAIAACNYMVHCNIIILIIIITQNNNEQL